MSVREGIFTGSSLIDAMISKPPSSHYHSFKYFPASPDTDKAMAPSCPGLPCVKSILATATVVTFAYVEHINEQPNYAHSGQKKRRYNYSVWALIRNQNARYITRSYALLDGNF